MRSLPALWRELTLTPTHKELLPKMCCRPGRRLKEIMILAGDRALTDQAGMNRMLRNGVLWLAYDELVPFFHPMTKNHQDEWIHVGSVTVNSSVAFRGASKIHGWEPRVYDIAHPTGMIIVDQWEFTRLLRAMPLQKNRDPDWSPPDVRQWLNDFLG